MCAEDKARYERELQENPEAQRKLEKKAKARAADARANKPALKASIHPFRLHCRLSPGACVSVIHWAVIPLELWQRDLAPCREWHMEDMCVVQTGCDC